MMRKTIHYISQLVGSRTTTYLILGAFIVQSLVFALIINTPDFYQTTTGDVYAESGVLPDEARHFNNIKFYSSSSLLNGPNIETAGEDTLFLGVVETFPSYLYYYIASLFTKILYQSGLEDIHVYIALRFITIVLSFVVLLIVRYLCRIVKLSLAQENLVLLGIVFTGAFSWMSSAISYDIPSLLLFLLVVSMCLQYLQTRRVGYVYLSFLFTLLLGVTKYTYIPTAGIAVITSIIFVWLGSGKSVAIYLNDFYRDTINVVKRRKVLSIVVLLGIVISGILFFGRVGGNLLEYQSVNPVCSKVYSRDQCMLYDLYARNTNRADLLNEADYQFHYQPFSYPGMWLETYFKSTYKFFGQMRQEYLTATQAIVATLAALAIIVIILTIRRIRLSQELRYVGIIAIVYCVILIVFNLVTYAKYQATYGYQGRYLHFPLIVLYMYLTMYARTLYGHVNDRNTLWLMTALVSIFVLFLVIFNPLFTYISEADSTEWYFDIGRL